MQCSNHIKQLGLAVHNFHDTQGGLPPSTVGFSGATLWLLIFPFIEQQALYDVKASQQSGTFKGFEITCNTKWWLQTVSENERKAFGSVSGYRCPSRRAAASNFTSGNFGGPLQPNVAVTNSDNYQTSGPCSDYAMVFHLRDYTGMSWYDCNDLGNTLHLERHFGPFRYSLPTTSDTGTNRRMGAWGVRNTFAYWNDGTSNQFVVGEKHIPSAVLGICDKSGTGNGYGNIAASDCSYLVLGSWASPGAGRGFRHSGTSFGIARTNDFDYDTTSDINALYGTGGLGFGFGSYHAGICQFLLGDGAVRGVSVTTPQAILNAFADVSDGEAISLP
jgi:hypothetical protein